MIKNYKLVLVGLFISYFLSNAMDKEEKTPIDSMFESFLSNIQEANKDKLTQEGIKKIRHIFNEEMQKILSSPEDLVLRNLAVQRLKNRGIDLTEENINKEKKLMCITMQSKQSKTTVYKVPKVVDESFIKFLKLYMNQTNKL